MDNVNLKSWASQPDVCRCCLANSGSWDMSAVYLNEAGTTEVYVNLLRDCFGISLSPHSGWSDWLVCNQCVEKLRSAYTFKKQVEQTEEKLISYLLSRQDTIIEKVSENGDDWVCSDSETIKKATHTRRKTVDCDSLPLVHHDDDVDCTSNTIKSTNTVPLRPIKQVSERKRIKTTCEAVILTTTACPFRHHRSWFQCFFCTQSFMELSALKLHTSQTHRDLHEEIKRLKRYPRSLQIDITELGCRSCEVDLGDVDGMILHVKDRHGLVVYKECIADYKVDRSPYSCHLCSKQFHVFRTLTTHLNEHYANCVCSVCGRPFLNARRLEVHRRSHQRGAFPCTRCGKVLTTKSSQANHLESHSKRVIRCQICSEPMKHYNARIKHMSEAHNITHTFKCHICGREYNIKHYLATHMRQTHGHKDKKCADCGMMFVTNHGLKKHMQRHSMVKAFSCEVCSKVYARSSSLRDHMRVHNILESHGAPVV